MEDSNALVKVIVDVKVVLYRAWTVQLAHVLSYDGQNGTFSAGLLKHFTC